MDNIEKSIKFQYLSYKLVKQIIDIKKGTKYKDVISS